MVNVSVKEDVDFTSVCENLLFFFIFSPVFYMKHITHTHTHTHTDTHTHTRVNGHVEIEIVT